MPVRPALPVKCPAARGPEGLSVLRPDLAVMLRSSHSKIQMVFGFGDSDFQICISEIPGVCLFSRAALQNDHKLDGLKQ